MITKLKVDIDRANIPRDFMARLRMLAAAHGLRVETVVYRRTVHGWHIVVACRGRIGFARCVTYQAILGSDWKREIFNSRRANAWRRVPGFWRERANVLYKRHSRSVSHA